jgi:hypothetical protein
MSITIVKGSQEEIIVAVVDNSDSPLTDLSGTSPGYETTESDGVTTVETGGTPTTSGMLLFCLIDGTDAGYVAGNKYHLYVTFTSSPEAPKLGPVEFYIT